MRIPVSWSVQALSTATRMLLRSAALLGFTSQSPPDLMFLGEGDLNRVSDEHICKFRSDGEGWAALAFVVDRGLDASPHLAGFSAVSEEALYPPPVGLGLFDAPPQVGSGSAAQRTVPQPQG